VLPWFHRRSFALIPSLWTISSSLVLPSNNLIPDIDVCLIVEPGYNSLSNNKSTRPMRCHADIS